MTIHFYSLLINGSIAVLFLSLAVLVLVAATGAGWWVIKRVADDIIQLWGLWQAQGNGQVLAELQQKSLALDLHHKGRMLDVEASSAEIPIKQWRVGLLASLEEVEKVES